MRLSLVVSQGTLCLELLFHWYMAGEDVIHMLAEGVVVTLNSSLVVAKEVILELAGFLFYCFPIHLGPLLDCALWFLGLLSSDTGIHYYHIVVRNARYPITRLDPARAVGTIQVYMMMSSNGNIFRASGHLCGEFTGHRWIPCIKASDMELWCFLWSAPH